MVRDVVKKKKAKAGARSSSSNYHPSQHTQSSLDATLQLLIPPLLIALLALTIYELFFPVNFIFHVFIDAFDIFVILVFATDLYFRWKAHTGSVFAYITKYWLDILATIPFNLFFAGIQTLPLLRGLRLVRIIGRAGRYVRLVRFFARAPRFIRLTGKVPPAQTGIRKVQPHEKKLKKTLSFKTILLITINSIMGTGIWFLTAAGAKHAGPASLVSWAILSLISLYISMCFAELVSMYPKAGGVYEFAKQAYGRFPSFVIGWTTAIAGAVTIAMLLLGALQYLIPIEYAFTYIPIAVALIVIFSYVAYRGMQTSTVMLVTFALITLFAVLAIILPGLIKFNPQNLDPFFVFPTMSTLLTIFFIAETFFGWESAVFLSAETKNPTKVMPKALIYGTLVIALLSFLLAFTAIGTIPWEQYAESVAPLRDLGEAHFGALGGVFFAILIFVSVIGATAGWVVTAPRLFMALAEDKLFFTQFAKIHPKNKSPYVSILFQVLVVSVLVVIGAGSYEVLLHMLIPLVILIYSSVLLAVIILRYKRPNVKRAFKVPFGKIGPFFTVLFMVFLLVMFIKETHSALDILRVSIGLVLFGLPAYFFIELFYEQKYAKLRQEIWARLLHYFPFLHPIVPYRRIIGMVGPLRAKTKIMSVSFPSDIFSHYLLRRAYAFGSILSLHQSQYELQGIKKKISSHSSRKKVTLKRVKSLSVLPGANTKNNFNVIVSYNDLGYTKNLPKFFKSVSSNLTRGGKFCLYVRHSFFDMKPNAIELDKTKELLKMAKESGLQAKYLKLNRVGYTEIFIYGKK